MTEPIIVNPEPIDSPKVPPCDLWAAAWHVKSWNGALAGDRESACKMLILRPIPKYIFHVTDLPHPAIVEAEEIIRNARLDWGRGFVPEDKAGVSKCDAWLAKYGSGK